MRNAVRTRLGVPAGDTFYTDEVLTDLVNEALQAVASDADWPWLTVSTSFPTVAGTGSYTPPADWTETRVLCIDGSDPIEWRSLAEIRQYPATSTGVPQIYYASANELILRPIPSSVMTVQHDYVKNEQTLVTDADVPLMPTQFRYSVVHMALHLAFLRAGDVQRATAAISDYAGWKTRMLRQRRRSAGPIRIRVRPGSAF